MIKLSFNFNNLKFNDFNKFYRYNDDLTKYEIYIQFEKRTMSDIYLKINENKIDVPETLKSEIFDFFSEKYDNYEKVKRMINLHKYFTPTIKK